MYGGEGPGPGGIRGGLGGYTGLVSTLKGVVGEYCSMLQMPLLAAALGYPLLTTSAGTVPMGEPIASLA